MRKQKGVTLLSLAITIVVLLILVGTFTYNIDSYVHNKRKGDITADLQRINEKVQNYYARNKQLPVLNKYTNLENIKNVISSNDNNNYYVVDLDEIGGMQELSLIYGKAGFEQVRSKDIKEEINNITDVFIVNEQSHVIYYPQGVEAFGEVIYNLEEETSKVQGAIRDIIIDGSWNENKKVNTPKIEGTGLTAIYWDEEGNEIELTRESKATDWSNWYDYDKQKWANAVTKDEDGNITGYFVWIPRYEYKIDSENKKIDVNFIQIGEGTTTGYILHPAFGTDIENGGWREDLPGFWVAKYEAGFQNATVGEETKTVQYSNLKYTTVNSLYTTNYLGTITANTTALSYPVFKANTYAYNLISVADAWLLSQEIDTASMYGLSNVDSHMLKNSEWGAVAYLTHSQYGVNGNSTAMNEITINSKNLSNSIYVNNAASGTKANVYAVTSYGNNNTPNDVNASSTKNMTGVFDLKGGTWERVAGFLQGGAASTPAYHNAMASSSTTASSKYLTLYTANNKVGDATNETAGWNSDYSDFVTSGGPVFYRGGSYYNGDDAGVFAFGSGSGGPYNGNGFRICLSF